MEEQKLNCKEVKMQPTAGGKQDSKENPQEKLPYDKLKEITDSLWNENRYLKHQLQMASDTIRTFNRLDYLFKVVEIMSDVTSLWHFSDDFTSKCIAEIENLMTPPEEETKEEVKEG